MFSSTDPPWPLPKKSAAAARFGAGSGRDRVARGAHRLRRARLPAGRHRPADPAGGALARGGRAERRGGEAETEAEDDERAQLFHARSIKESRFPVNKIYGGAMRGDAPHPSRKRRASRDVSYGRGSATLVGSRPETAWVEAALRGRGDVLVGRRIPRVMRCPDCSSEVESGAAACPGAGIRCPRPRSCRRGSRRRRWPRRRGASPSPPSSAGWLPPTRSTGKASRPARSSPSATGSSASSAAAAWARSTAPTT